MAPLAVLLDNRSFGKHIFQYHRQMAAAEDNQIHALVLIATMLYGGNVRKRPAVK